MSELIFHVQTTQRPAALKPLLQRLDNSRATLSDGFYKVAAVSEADPVTQSKADDDSTAERRIRFLENSLRFLRHEHEALLSALHRQIDDLKSTNQSTTVYRVSILFSIYLLINLFDYPSIHPCVRSFVRSFIHS